MADLPGNILGFCAFLRTECGFAIGHAQAHEALRAIEAVGIRDRERVKCALRAVCCSAFDDLEPFDRAFEAFFTSADAGIRQPRPPRTQAGEESADARGGRREPHDERLPARATQTLRARYSAVPRESVTPPAVPMDELAENLTNAARLIAALHLGRSRRWKPHAHGTRFDVRRTMRASLQTGGDPAHLRTLGHPLRNPRIVLLIDGSRSMSDHAPELLRFAYAVCRRSRRTRAFVFSTGLREITRDLRNLPHRGEAVLQALGEAWGGGTRIGASLTQFVREHGSLLDADTLTVIASDGLDAGEPAAVKHAMRNIDRRCAGIVWLNPHAGAAGFQPSARGMKAALPYVSALLDAKHLESIGTAVRYLRR